MKTTPFIDLHRDGSIRARGQTRDGVAEGHWEWFRQDGTKLRSGEFTAGMQTGQWITYDKSGQVYKSTIMTPKQAAKVKPIIRPKKKQGA